MSHTSFDSRAYGAAYYSKNGKKWKTYTKKSALASQVDSGFKAFLKRRKLANPVPAKAKKNWGNPWMGLAHDPDSGAEFPFT